jgi:ribosomal-protein-alanine N-acetyltransferase
VTDQIDDLDRIMAIMQGAFEPEYCEAWSRRQVADALLIGNCHYLLAGPDGERFGNQGEQSLPAAGFALSRTTYREEELLLIAVLPQYRRAGIAARLLEQLLSDARERGADRLMLEMRRGNPAESLYLRYGFVPVGSRPNYYRTLGGPRIDAITFCCTLD